MTKNKVLVPDHIAAELENDKAEENKSEVFNGHVRISPHMGSSY